MYVNTDEGWESSKRDAQGRLQWSKSAYPSGGPAFIDRVHKQKLKFGFPAHDGPWSSHGRHTAPRVALTAEHVQVQGESPCMLK